MPQILVSAVVQRTRIPVMLTHSRPFPLHLRKHCQILSEDPMTIVVFSILRDKPFPPQEVCELDGFTPSCLGCRLGVFGLQRNWVREMNKFQTKTNKAPKLLLVSQNKVGHWHRQRKTHLRWGLGSAGFLSFTINLTFTDILKKYVLTKIPKRDHLCYCVATYWIQRLCSFTTSTGTLLRLLETKAVDLSILEQWTCESSLGSKADESEFNVFEHKLDFGFQLLYTSLQNT